jgi:type II secretion system protein G
MMRSKLAFTLIELLIVVAIIGILAAIAVPNFLNAQVRAKLARAVSNMRAVSVALEAYYIDNNSYCWWATDSNNWQGLWQLSTPISYISSENAFRNPFIKSTRFDGDQNRFYNEIDSYIELGTFKNPAGIQSAYQHGWPSQIYLLESSGPDKGDDYDTHAYPIRGLVFHISNGLSSRGDLFRGGGSRVENWVGESN